MSVMAAFVWMFSVTPLVSAATITVSNTSNSGPGSHRQAIIDTNSTSASDTINFNIGSGAAQIALSSVFRSNY